jgi:hypothetical protein
MPADLPGDTVRERFPLANIPAEGAIPENLGARRHAREETLAAYVQAEFSLLDERIEGNLGVRVVRADLSARALAGSTLTTDEASHTDALPSFNLVGHLTDDLQLRFGYAKGLTRPNLADLNPFVTVNTVNGTGSRGNPDLEGTIARLQAYEQAGADVLYAPALRTVEEIGAVCQAVSKPVNVLAVPSLSMAEIVAAGARRVSVGGSLTWVAVSALVDAAKAIRDAGDLSPLGVKLPLADWLS